MTMTLRLARAIVALIRGTLAFRSCTSVGRLCRASFGWPDIVNRGTLRLGSRVWVASSYATVRLETLQGGSLVIGDRSGVNYGASITAADSVVIGEDVSIAPYCVISDMLPSPSHGEPLETAPVVIEDRCWLAGRVVVSPGARIGRGSVITAGTHVSGEVPPGVVYGGAPPRVLRRVDGAHSSGPIEHVGPEQSRSTGRDAARREVELSAGPEADRPPAEHRALLIADFTVDPMVEFLDPSRGEPPSAGPRVAGEVAPFDQVIPTLLTPPEDGDVAVVWTRPDAALDAFRRLLDGEPVQREELEDDVDQFADLVATASPAFNTTFVPTWVMPTWRRGRGLIDTRPGGESWALGVANARLMTRFADTRNVFVLDVQRWVGDVGGKAFNEQLWFAGKLLFGDAVLHRAAVEIRAALAAIAGRSRKLLVVDLDNTLWGGVVGDVGVDGLVLGGHDAGGEAYRAFQQDLLRLKNRGVLLAVVSKNEEQVALAAMDGHPSMALKRSDLVGWKINWNDKAQNLVDLAEDLNLGLQSVVFIDDDAHERARVREALPEVLVPEWPANPVDYCKALGGFTCFDATTISAEDRARTEMYTAERERRDVRAVATSIDDWIEDLNIVVTVEELSSAMLGRATQLLNKTNQMNLTTRRMSEEALLDWSSGPNRRCYVLSVSDRIGDSGLTGIVSVEANGETTRLVDFVLSCRVMGRRIEDAMVAIAAEASRELGASKLVARLAPTEKNTPCQRYFAKSSMTSIGENEYELEVDGDVQFPSSLKMVVRA